MLLVLVVLEWQFDVVIVVKSVEMIFENDDDKVDNEREDKEDVMKDDDTVDRDETDKEVFKDEIVGGGAKEDADDEIDESAVDPVVDVT